MGYSIEYDGDDKQGLRAYVRHMLTHTDGKPREWVAEVTRWQDDVERARDYVILDLVTVAKEEFLAVRRYDSDGINEQVSDDVELLKFDEVAAIHYY